MVIQFQTSFIPRKAPIITPPSYGIKGHHINALAVLAVVMFFAVIALALLAFFYKSHLVRTIVGMDTSLALAKKSFDPEFIAAASKLNARIEGAKELLNAHRALSPLFDVLEKKTLENVRFQDFNFNATRGKDITVGMTGQAKSFNAVALQSDVFATERSFKDPIFSNFSLNERGDVMFNFKTTIDPELLLYSETLLGSADSEGDDGASDAGVETSNE